MQGRKTCLRRRSFLSRRRRRKEHSATASRRRISGRWVRRKASHFWQQAMRPQPTRPMSRRWQSDRTPGSAFTAWLAAARLRTTPRRLAPSIGSSLKHGRTAIRRLRRCSTPESFSRRRPWRRPLPVRSYYSCLRRRSRSSRFFGSGLMTSRFSGAAEWTPKSQTPRLISFAESTSSSAYSPKSSGFSGVSFNQ